MKSARYIGYFLLLVVSVSLSLSSAQQSDNQALVAPGRRYLRSSDLSKRSLEDGGAGSEWWEKYAEKYADQTDDEAETFFDDDRYAHIEVVTRSNFWSMFSNAPAYWTFQQWLFLWAMIAISGVCLVCAFKCFIPCC